MKHYKIDNIANFVNSGKTRMCHWLRDFTLSGTLLAFIDKYGIQTNQWTWLSEALLEVSMTKKVLWIRVCADDWPAKSAIIASNDGLNIDLIDITLIVANSLSYIHIRC